MSAKLASVWAGGQHGVDDEVVRTWVEEDTPISVISSVIDVLSEADDIVEADLRKREVTAHHALSDTAGGERPAAMRLCGVEAYLSVRGQFHMTEKNDSTITFQAPYGRPSDPGGPHVRVTCAASGLRGLAVPTGFFPARCLGRVQDWKSEERCLVLHPIAIFW